MPKVNLFPVSVIISQTINHHGLSKVFINKSKRSKQPLTNTSELKQKMTTAAIIYREIRLNKLVGKPRWNMNH